MIGPSPTALRLSRRSWRKSGRTCWEYRRFASRLWVRPTEEAKRIPPFQATWTSSSLFCRTTIPSVSKPPFILMIATWCIKEIAQLVMHTNLVLVLDGRVNVSYRNEAEEVRVCKYVTRGPRVRVKLREVYGACAFFCSTTLVIARLMIMLLTLTRYLVCVAGYYLSTVLAFQI